MQKQKRFLSYCPKLHEVGLEPGPFQFVTNVRTNSAIDYLRILEFLFWMHSAYWTYRSFSDIFMYVMTYSIINKKIKTKSQKLKVTSQQLKVESQKVKIKNWKLK